MLALMLTIDSRGAVLRIDQSRVLSTAGARRLRHVRPPALRDPPS
jgi:hypothetical protein